MDCTLPIHHKYESFLVDNTCTAEPLGLFGFTTFLPFPRPLPFNAFAIASVALVSLGAGGASRKYTPQSLPTVMNIVGMPSLAQGLSSKLLKYTLCFTLVNLSLLRPGFSTNWLTIVLLYTTRPSMHTVGLTFGFSTPYTKSAYMSSMATRTSAPAKATSLASSLRLSSSTIANGSITTIDMVDVSTVLWIGVVSGSKVSVKSINVSTLTSHHPPNLTPFLSISHGFFHQTVLLANVDGFI